MRVNGLQSRSIDVMRFAMILLVVVLHAYTSTRSDFSAGDFPVYRLVSFVCSLEIAQTAVPALFFISGFLFFLHPKPYKTKLRKPPNGSSSLTCFGMRSSWPSISGWNKSPR